LAETEKTELYKRIVNKSRVFRTAYYVAKNNKPFTDFEHLIDLQEGNSLDMGRVLHSKTVAVDMIDHVSSHMKKKF